MKRFFTTNQAASVVGASGFTIRQEIEAGRLPAMLINTQWRIAVADLERWVQSHYQGRNVTIDRITGELVFHDETALATAS
jgi:excisionase family DNA binding protein